MHDIDDSADRTVLRPAARTLTILFADIDGMGALYDRLGDEQGARLAMACLDGLARLATEEGGRVIKRREEGIHAVFARAQAAFASARAMQGAFDASETRLRIGLHTGEVLSHADGDVYGDAVNLAARVCGFAVAGETIFTEAHLTALPEGTADDAQRIGSRVLKGQVRATRLYRLRARAVSDATLGEGTHFTTEKTRPPVGWETVWRVIVGDREVSMSDGPAGQVTVGRSADRTLPIAAPRASREHGHLSLAGGRLSFTDTSRNGTHVAPPKGLEIHLLRDSIELAPGSTLSLGTPRDRAAPEHLIHVRLADADPASD